MKPEKNTNNSNPDKEIIEINQREGAIISKNSLIATRGLATCYFIVLHNSGSGISFGFHCDGKTYFESPNSSKVDDKYFLIYQTKALMPFPLDAYIYVPEGVGVNKEIRNFLEKLEVSINGLSESKDPGNELVYFDPEKKAFCFLEKTISTNKGPDNNTRIYNFAKSRMNSRGYRDCAISIEYDFRQPKNKGWLCRFGIEKETECNEALESFRRDIRSLWEKYGLSATSRMNEVKLMDIELTKKSKHLDIKRDDLNRNL